MPARPTVLQLPDPVRAELDARLIKSGFAGYVGLAQWLSEQGFEISKSALHRYGQQFEERVQALKIATDQAKAMVEVAPDDEGAVSDALMRLVQEKLFGVLMNLGEIDPARINLGTLAKAIAQLGRASVTQKKWQTEVRDRAKAAAAEVESIARKGGLSPDTVSEIRRQILGIAQ